MFEARSEIYITGFDRHKQAPLLTHYEIIETDLGEYILQLDNDPPSHIVVPAIHKDRYQIRKVLNEKLNYEGSETPEDMTLFIRQRIRQDFK